MFLSKIWFILIAVAAGVAVTVALVAPRPAVQKLSALEGQRLDRAQYAAEQMLKVDAHKWIDRVSKLGRDAIISESLDSASRGAGEINVIHKTVQDRFHSLIPDLASGGIAALVAVDNKGRVVARAGENDKEYGDYVTGAEMVARCAARLPVRRRLGHERPPDAHGRRARAVQGPRPHRRRALHRRRDRRQLRRAPQEEPGRRRGAVPARQAGRHDGVRGRARAGAGSHRAARAGDRDGQAHAGDPLHGRQRRAARGGCALRRPGRHSSRRSTCCSASGRPTPTWRRC